MFKARELLHIFVAVIIVAFVMGFFDIDLFFYFFVCSLILFAINIFSKKITAYILHSEIETSIWYVKRYGFHGSREFDKPLPFGIFIPLIFSIISAVISYSFTRSFFILPWLAVTEFDVRALKSRVAKKFGLYRYSEMTEFHIGLIAAVGIVACLIAAVLGYLLNFPVFAKFAVYFACFNMLPFSNLDGSKIFFGSYILWFILGFFCLIGLGYALL